MLKEYYQIVKNNKHTIKNKTDKNCKRTTYCLGCKDYTDNVKPQEVKMSLEKNQTALLVDLVNQHF